MTRVILSPDLLEYQRMMAHIAQQIKRAQIHMDFELQTGKNFSLPLKTTPYLEIYNADRLKPSSIKMIDLSEFHGRGNDLILITIAYDYDILDVLVSISDDQGNIIESSDAIEASEEADMWGYITTNLIPPHASITVKVTARDFLGGVATQNVSLTIL